MIDSAPHATNNSGPLPDISLSEIAKEFNPDLFDQFDSSSHAKSRLSKVDGLSSDLSDLKIDQATHPRQSSQLDTPDVSMEQHSKNTSNFNNLDS